MQPAGVKDNNAKKKQIEIAVFIRISRFRWSLLKQSKKQNLKKGKKVKLELNFLFQWKRCDDHFSTPPKARGSCPRRKVWSRIIMCFSANWYLVLLCTCAASELVSNVAERRKKPLNKKQTFKNAVSFLLPSPPQNIKLDLTCHCHRLHHHRSHHPPSIIPHLVLTAHRTGAHSPPPVST